MKDDIEKHKKLLNKDSELQKESRTIIKQNVTTIVKEGKLPVGNKESSQY